jgi:hypothetical protein
MATRWPDVEIAVTLNRLGRTTGQGNSWNERRVGNYRRKAGITGYESAVKDGRCLTMLEAAWMLGVTCHVIRMLIRDGHLPARQVVFDAPWQILAADLQRPEVHDGRHVVPVHRVHLKPGQACGVQIELDPMRIGLRDSVEVEPRGRPPRLLQAPLPLLNRRRSTASSRQRQRGWRSGVRHPNRLADEATGVRPRDRAASPRRGHRGLWQGYDRHLVGAAHPRSPRCCGHARLW